MFSILNVTTHIPKENTNLYYVKTDNMNINFYSQTLELISKFLKEVGCKEKRSLRLLKEFLQNTQCNDKSFPNYERLQISRLNFIDDLRFLVMSSLDNPSKENRKSLKNIHSLLHLISLVNNTKLSSFYILNTWLNSNCLLKEGEDVLHAMRGNIGNLIKLYPENREAFEEIAKIESHFRNNKISELKYNLLKEEWSERFKHLIPKKMYNIFMQNYFEDYHWTEILCYKLAYGKTKNSLIDSLEDIKDLIPDNDELYYILIGDHTSLIKNSTKWMKLIYCLLYDVEDKIDIYESIIEVGLDLLETDWQVALDYFSFTMYANHHFNFIISKIELNPIIFDFLFRYANRNGLDCAFLFSKYTSCLLNKKNYLDYLKFINAEYIKDYEIPHDFVKFLMHNFENIEDSLTQNFRSSFLGEYLVLFSKFLKNPIDMNKDEINEFVNNQYTALNISLILNVIINNVSVPEMLIIKLLDLILYKQRELLLSDSEINIYKIKMVRKLQTILQDYN